MNTSTRGYDINIDLSFLKNTIVSHRSSNSPQQLASSYETIISFNLIGKVAGLVGSSLSSESEWIINVSGQFYFSELIRSGDNSQRKR